MGKNRVKKELCDKQKLQVCADTFGVVGDLTRIKICWILCHHPELPVGEIADLLNKEPSLISHGLKKLREAGVVHGRQEAKYVYYSLTLSPTANFIKSTLS